MPLTPSLNASNLRSDLLRDELLHEIFLASARHRPLHPAVKCRGESIPYAELLRRSACLANYLRGMGAGRGQRVALWMPRGVDMYVAMLGILQSGAAYVPLDPEYPLDRVAYVVRDSGACALITARALAPVPGALPCRTIVFEDEAAGMATLPAIPPTRAETGIGPDDCAYIIYTSGSTGRPKGVMISHRSIAHLVRSEGSVLGLRGDDIVFQGFSLSFDMSLEEIWPAWAAGATLLTGTTEMIRSGSDLAPLLAAEGLTVWSCVPTLLAMQEHPVPTLRLLNLGGEACPPELVRRWARPGLRILNTYGPTEASITATYAEVTPDRPVTIGQPLPNYTTRILDERLAPVPPGQSGELFIGGPGLALGYVGRADLTAEKFIPNPLHLPGGHDPILYRTGDLARLNADGDLEFLGRIDTQVKIRGFRVELSEIESVLITVSGAKNAVVTLRQDEAPGSPEVLVAYLLPGPGGLPESRALRALLKERLPAYMVPAHFEVVEDFPTLPSGKIDRKSLPPPRSAAPEEEAAAAEPPSTPTEKALHGIWAALFAPRAVGLDEDFFLDLGGHSLLAATTVSRLRKLHGLQHVSMTDVYNHPTLRKLAARMDASRPAPAAESKSAARPGFAAVPPLRFALCAAAQAVSLVFIFAIFSLQWFLPYLAYAYLISEEVPQIEAAATSLILFVVAIPVMLTLGIVAKWVILGRLRPGSYPLWGLTYFRWWLTSRILETVPIDYLGGTPLINLYYRLLGARIGHGVHLGSDTIDNPDTAEIGPCSSFSSGSSLSGARVEGGMLHVGPIRIGAHCHIGATSTVALGAVMEDHSELADLSMLPSGQTIPHGQAWGGSPARPLPRPSVTPPRAPHSTPLRRLHTLLYAVLLLIFPVFTILPLLPGMFLMAEIDQNTDTYHFLLLSPVLALLFVLGMCLQIAGLKWLLIGRVRPGAIPVQSLAYVRHWLADKLLELSLDTINPLYATIYLPTWFRLLGVHMGQRAEVSTASSIGFDLLSIGDESFIADAVTLGPPTVREGTLTLTATTIGRRAFVGNSAVVPSGTSLGDGVLVGCLSLPPEDPADAMQAESSWFGTPALYLPQRQAAGQFDEGSTFRPTWRLIGQRMVIELIRVILPLTATVCLTSILMSVVADLNTGAPWIPASLTSMFPSEDAADEPPALSHAHPPTDTPDEEDEGDSYPGLSLWQIGLLFPLLYLCYALTAGGIVVVLKWVVVGRYRPTEKPLWNNFVWRSELVTSTYENLAVPFFATWLKGTPFLAVYLRLLGAKIGRRVFLDTTDVTEFDVLEIGDDAALNADSGPQTHLFEDRVMKISTVRIGARCTVGAGSIVLYDAEMEDGSALGELSMLMKGETLPAGTEWEGSPARPVA